MSPTPQLPAIDWAMRVNQSWIVRRELNKHAETWLEYLTGLDDGRFEASCEVARAMCGIRDRTDDPKPWFYAGLFSLATKQEAQQFLATHPITTAAIPAMAEDDHVKSWIDQISPDTRKLVAHLRKGLTRALPPQF